MSDPADDGNETARLFLEAALAAQKVRGVVRPFTGRCYNCEDLVDAPAHFCSKECAEDFDHREKRKWQT